MNASDVLNKGFGALGGATNLLSSAQQAAQISDTSQYLGQIDDLMNMDFTGVTDVNDIIGNYDKFNSIPNVTAGSIRGMSDGQKIGNFFGSALSGASTGLSVGGPWGALAGAIIGHGTSLAGILVGDANAEREANYINTMSKVASNVATNNANAAVENLQQQKANQNIVNASAMGGPIQRKQMTADEFSAFVEEEVQKDRLVYSRNRKSVDGGIQFNQVDNHLPRRAADVSRIKRQYCDGGVKISIRMK